MHLSPTNKVSRDSLSAMVKLAEEIGESTAEFFSLRCWEQCLELLSSLCCILEEKGFMHDPGSNGVGVGWSYGNALVGEFMFTFLRVFTVFQTAANSDFDFSSMCAEQHSRPSRPAVVKADHMVSMRMLPTNKGQACDRVDCGSRT